MSKPLTKEDVLKVAALSRLSLSDKEVDEMTCQLGAILNYVAQLETLDTENVEPLAHCLPIHNALREDVVKPSLSNEKALSNAPQTDDHFFAVPKVLGEGSA